MLNILGNYFSKLFAWCILMTDNLKMLSRKVPFYQYSQNAEILSALSRGELPARPVLADNDTDKIEDSFWDLITKCCVPKPNRRLTLPDIRKWLGNLGLEDNRPPAKPLPGNEILKLWETHRGVDVEHMRDVLAQIKVGRLFSQLQMILKAS
jgi:serine/threonine protein kinase